MRKETKIQNQDEKYSHCCEETNVWLMGLACGEVGRFQSCRQEEHSESTEKMDCCAGSSGGQIPREMNTINTQVMTSQKGDKDSWRLG